jgi:hypothetical protein
MFEQTSAAFQRAQAPSQAPIVSQATRSPDNTQIVDPSSPLADRMHGILLGHYLNEVDRHSLNRIEMELDEKFYDNDPWSEEEKAILAARGQLPTNFNVTSTTINWLIGTERRGRTDFKVLPRKKEGAQAAARKTDLLKYLSDANNTDFAFSQAFASSIKAGVGWVESGWQGDDDGEPIYDRCESWRNILWDSYSRESDLSDARYIMRTRWTDLDTAQAMFPDRAELLRNSAMSMGFVGGGAGIDTFGDSPMDSMENWASGLLGGLDPRSNVSRDRVRLIEAWFRRPMNVKTMSGGQFAGEIFDPFSEGHLRELDSGRAGLVQRMRMRVFVAVFTPTGMLHVQESPYRHNRLPFTPIWCYRNAETGLPYGLIRGLRDLQTHINKAASKAQYILSTNKVVMDEGAVDDLDAFEEEVARPDAIIVKKPGKELVLNADRGMDQAHLDLMSRMIAMIQMSSGVTDENLGRQTNARSGKAIALRQEQGALATAELFDNLRYARKAHGEKLLSLIEQFMSEEKSFRITNQRGTPQYVTVNDPNDPESDITTTKADFVISEQAWNATMRQAGAEALIEFISRVAPGQPQILMGVLDLITEAMDIPNRDEIVKRIRQMTGQKDPDADPNTPPTPDEAAQDQIRQEQAKLKARAEVANVEKLEADAKLSSAKAAQAEASTIYDRLDAMQKALETAIAMMTVPSAVRPGDALLASAISPDAQMPPGGMPPGPARAPMVPGSTISQAAAPSTQQIPPQPGAPAPMPAP